MTDIDNFLNALDEASEFVRFEDGEPVVGKYVGAKLVDDTFNKGEKTMEYTIEVKGVNKSWKSRSGKLARQIQSVEEGDQVQVVKTGEGFDTNWYAKKI